MTKPKSNRVESNVEVEQQLQKQKEPMSVENDPNDSSRSLNIIDIDDDDDIEIICEKTNSFLNRKGLQPSRDKDQPAESEEQYFDLTVAKFQCQFCQDSLVGISNLNTHLRRVHKAKVELTCSLCGETFHKNRNLINHLEEHRTNPDKFSPESSSKSRTTRGRKKSNEPDTDTSQSSKTKKKSRKHKNKTKEKFKKSKSRVSAATATGTGTGRSRRKRGAQSSEGTNGGEGENGDASERPTSPVLSVHNLNSASKDKSSASAKISPDDIDNKTGCLSNDIAPPSPPPASPPPSPPNAAQEDDWGWDTDFQVPENNPSGLGPSALSLSAPSSTSKLKRKSDLSPDSVFDDDYSEPEPLSPPPQGTCDEDYEDDVIWGNDHHSVIKHGNLRGNISPSPLPFPCSKCTLCFRTGDLLRIHQTYHDLLIFVKFRCERFSCSQYFDDAADYQKHFTLRHVKRRRRGSCKRLFRAKATYPCKYCFKKSRSKSEATSHSATHFGQVEVPIKMHFSNEDEEGEDSELRAPLKGTFQSVEPEPEPEPTPGLGCDQNLVATEVNEGRKGKEEDSDEVINVGDSDDEPDLKPVIRMTLSGKSLRSKLMPVKRLGVSRVPEAVRVPSSSPRVYRHRGASNDCPVCTKTCRTQVELDFHMRTHSGCTPFPCSDCPMKFSKPSLLRRHVTSAHSSHRSFSCPQCPDKSFSRRHDLRRHIASHNRTGTFICPTCGKAFKRNGHLREHISRKHTQERPFVCSEPNCTSAFLTPSELRRHARSHDSYESPAPTPAPAPVAGGLKKNPVLVLGVTPKSHQCKYCDKAPSTPSALKKHISRLHGDKLKPLPPPKRKKDKSGKVAFVCEYCEASYNTLLGWARHKLKHDENTDILCNLCGRQFPSSENMEDHKNDRHPKWIESEKKSTLIHVCEICGKILTSQGGLKIHMERHTGVSFICDVCGKLCITKGDLKFHKLTHLSEKPYACDFCPYRYNHPSSIYQHMQRDHTGPGGDFVESYLTDGLERTFVCEEAGCSESFTSLRCLKHHQLYHRGLKKRGCRKCDMKFITKFDAYNHSSQVHQKVFYECEHCKKVMKGRVTLEAHIRYNHTNEEPFPCTKCERKFKTKGDLTYHTAAAHTGEYKFSCPVCGKKVITKGNLNAHMRVHTGARVFRCDVDGCEASFKASSILKRHLFKEHGRSDVLARERKCSRPGSGSGSGNGNSAKPAKAKGHVLSRTNPNNPDPDPDPDCRVPCEVCGKKFPNVVALESHSRDAHGEVEDELNVRGSGSVVSDPEPEPEPLQQRILSTSIVSPEEGNRDILLGAAERDTQRISLSQYIPHYGESSPGNSSAIRSRLEAASEESEDAVYYSQW